MGFLDYSIHVTEIRRKPVKTYVLKIDLRKHEIKPVWNTELGTTSSAVERTRALAGMNGSYFSKTQKLPFNKVIIKSKLMQYIKLEGTFHRAAIVITKGGKVLIDRTDSELFPKRNYINHMIQAGPLLVKDGKIVFSRKMDEEMFRRSWEMYKKEEFDSDITKGRYSRTAVGLTEGHAWFFVVDGRQEESEGVTLRGLARLMKEFGIRDALNLDGGGSSTLVIGNKLINKPAGSKRKKLIGVEREVKTHLCVYKK